MKTIATISALVLSLAAPAFADTASAINHFNQDKTGGERVVLEHVTLSSRSANVQADVFARFNAQADTQDEVVGLNGATLISGEPAVAADIFAKIRAEGLENE